jgi:hypothetical protein
MFDHKYMVASLLLLGLGVAAQVSAQHNTLTAAETSSGYVSLFNGTSLTGWRSWNSTTPPGGWVVAPESTWKVIQLNNPIGNAGAIITTDATYRDFDLKIEWNVQSTHNSGIFSRYDGFQGSSINNSWGGATGPESQIAATNNSDGTDDLHRAGACYDMFPLDAKAKSWDTPGGATTNYGVYQQFRIIAYGSHVAHFGNGMKLLEYVIRSPAWTAAYNSSKYAPYPHYADVHPGSIYLQDHSEVGIKFRDMRIKKLTQNPWALGSVYLVNPNDTTSGLRDLSFADNMFAPVFIQGTRKTRSMKFQFNPQQGKVPQLFQNSGEYLIDAQGILGRHKSFGIEKR